MRPDFDEALYDYATLRETLRKMNPADIAEGIGEMQDQQEIKIFRMLPKDTAAEVFAYLPRDAQQNIIYAIKDFEISGIIDELFVDDAVDFIEEMPAGIVKRVLSNLPAEKRDIINSFLKYPEGSVGSIMTIEYVDLKEYLTVAQAFERIRRDGVDKETIYICYVIDAARRLLGVVSARTLLLSSPDERIGDIMEHEVIFASTNDDKESIVADFRKYGLLAIPVVDNEQRLVGIVTFDDVLELQEEEATEDFELMAAMSPSDEPYLRTSVWTLTWNRLPWLMLLMLTATITGAIIAGFEDSLAVMPILITFIPMLMDTGGNSGSQSSTLVIRGMALEEIRPSDVLKVWWKEIRVAVLCGAALAVINFFRVLIFNRDAIVGVSVSLTLFMAIVFAKSIGCLLPQLAKRLGLDPAVMASPVITTIVDAGVLLVYFSITKIVFGI